MASIIASRPLCLLPLLALLLALIAGCTTDDGTDNAGEVRVLNPFSGTRHYVYYRWTETGNAGATCPAGFRADTTLLAEVVADLPGGIHSARLYRQNALHDEYEAIGGAVYPSGSPFTIPFYYSYGNYGSDYSSYAGVDTQQISFCVGVIAGDESFHLSGPVFCTVVSGPELLPPALPAAPLLRSCEESPSYYSTDAMNLQWCNGSGNVEGHDICYQSSFDSQPRIQTTEHTSSAAITDYLPLTEYRVWLRARNRYGVSAASDTIALSTRAPLPPTDLRLGADWPQGVYLIFHNHHACDSLRIARREADGDWSVVATLRMPVGDNLYAVDSTALPHHSFSYRLGLDFPTGLWWSDSLSIALP